MPCQAMSAVNGAFFMIRRIVATLTLSAAVGLIPPAVVAQQVPLTAPEDMPPQDQIDRIPTDTALLRWLDKLTGRVSDIAVPVGETVHHETLEIIVRTCQKNPPEEEPENAAFLDIWEIKPGQPTEEVFRGWMFSSSPALSAMEHPIYDVWVLECVNQSSTAESPGKE